MDNNVTIQKISTNCGSLPYELRKEKDLQHFTNQQIADETGLALSTVNKLLAGELKNPGIFPVAAVAAYLGMSLDVLTGITDIRPEQLPEVDRLRLELGHAEEMRSEKEDTITRIMEWNHKLERSISARDTLLSEKNAIIAQKDLDLAAARKADRPLLYILSALCALLAVALLTYVFLDVRKPNQGLIRSDGVSPVVFIGGACMIILLIMLLHFADRRIHKKRR